MRHRALAILVTAIALGAVFPSPAATATARRPASPPASAALPAASAALLPSPPLAVAPSNGRLPAARLIGVNADLTQYDAAALAGVVDRLARAGVQAVRQPARWADLEPAPGRFDWQPLDHAIDALDAAGIAALVTVETAPAWARRDPPPPAHWFVCGEPGATDPTAAHLAPPTDPADLARFAAALAGRYHGKIWALEIWREPNILPHWRRGGPDPEDYGGLLTAVATAVRAADPAVLVVSAGLAPTTDVGVCYMSDAVFLARLARGGFLSAVDAVGIEPFGLREGPAAGPVTRDTLGLARAELLHATLVRWGVDRPLWAVAWGWHAKAPAATPPSSPPSSPWGSHPPAVAARWLGEGWARARADWPWLGPMFVWHLQPPAPPGDPVWGFALLDPSGRPTALWGAVAAIAAGDAPPPPGRTDGIADRSGPAGSAALLAVLLALILAAAAALGRWRLALQPWVRRALAPTGRLPAATAAVAAAALALANVGTGPLAAAGILPAGAAAAAAVLTLAALAWVLAGQPRIAIGAAAAALPFNYGLALRLAARPVSPVELLVALAAVGAAARWYADWRGERSTLPRLGAVHALDALAGLLAAWAALSIAWADHRAPALYQWRTVIAEPLILYALLRAARDRRAAAQAAVDGVVLGGVAAAVWGLAGVAAAVAGVKVPGLTGVGAEGVVRALGPYGSPNNLALYLGRVAAVVGAWVMFGRPNRRRAYALAGVPVALALAATFSRGLVVAGLPALAVFAIAVSGSRARRALAAIAITAALGAVLVVPFADTPRVRDTFKLQPGTTLYIRVRLWEAAVEMARDHPWLGVGLDNFLYHYRDFYVRRDVIQDGSLNHPHNWLLDWWTRLGLPGLAVWLALVLGNARAGWDALRRRRGRDPSRPRDPLAVAALGMQVYALAHGLVDNSFFLVDLAALWWIAQAALLAGRDARPAGQGESPLGPPYGQPHL